MCMQYSDQSHSFQRYATFLPIIQKYNQSLNLYLPVFDGLSSENSACHRGSHPGALPFAGDFAGDLAGDWVPRCRCSDRIDFEGDFDRCRAWAGDAARESGLAADSFRTCFAR